jgi:hypothetical protein
MKYTATIHTNEASPTVASASRRGGMPPPALADPATSSGNPPCTGTRSEGNRQAICLTDTVQTSHNLVQIPGGGAPPPETQWVQAHSHPASPCATGAWHGARWQDSMVVWHSTPTSHGSEPRMVVGTPQRPPEAPNHASRGRALGLRGAYLKDLVQFDRCGHGRRVPREETSRTHRSSNAMPEAQLRANKLHREPVWAGGGR